MSMGEGGWGGGGGVFFFFKQKTAYEIKECDWSSDVCSSDLKNIFIVKHETLQQITGSNNRRPENGKI